METGFCHDGELHNFCPTCGERTVGGCRCMLADMCCENGHHWFICFKHQKTVIGESDHSKDIYECQCNETAFERQQPAPFRTEFRSDFFVDITREQAEKLLSKIGNEPGWNSVKDRINAFLKPVYIYKLRCNECFETFEVKESKKLNEVEVKRGGLCPMCD